MLRDAPSSPTDRRMLLHRFLLFLSFALLVSTFSFGSSQQVVTDIQNMSGWASCDTCAGPGGHGHPNQHWMHQHESNPSMDGKTAEFYLGHTTDGQHNYSNVLFYKRLPPHTNATNFTLDFYVWVTDPTVIQGLERDGFFFHAGNKNY